jgi:hypothetical protein
VIEPVGHYLRGLDAQVLTRARSPDHYIDHQAAKRKDHPVRRDDLPAGDSDRPLYVG